MATPTPVPNSYTGEKNQSTPLTAIVQIVDGELIIFPIADSDADRAAILQALRNCQQ
jgi:hypothetical protein